MKKLKKGLALILIIVSVLSFAACDSFNKDNTDNTYANDWSEWTLTTSPTCVTEGMETRVSLNNNSIVETRSVPIKHNWGKWEVINAPTCLVSGIETSTCIDCGNFDFHAISALGHDWGEWKIAVSSCTETGMEMRICKRDDNHTDMRAASTLGHDWTDWVVTTIPTCSISGIETRFCKNDNYHTETRVISEFGHDWTDWVITSHPTETTDGVETRVCRNKAHTETRKLFATGTLGLVYSLTSNNTEYIVSNYTGSSVNVSIPNYHNNLPVTGIDSYTFAWKYELKSVVIGANIKVIGYRAFYEAYMTRVIFEEGSQLEDIDEYAFICSRNLEIIEIPANVKRLGDSAFSNCYSLETVIFENSSKLQHIGDGVFVNNYKLKTIEIPAAMTEINDSMFYGCVAMTFVTFANPDKITKIGRRAFMYCYALENFEIPANVTAIGEEAFYMAHEISNLKSIKINADKITEIGDWAFGDWKAAQTIYVYGFSCQAEADAAWFVNWRRDCRANIVYVNPQAELFNRIFVKDGIDYIDYNIIGEIRQVTRSFKPIYNNDNEIIDYYLSFESLSIVIDMGDGFVDCSVDVSYNLALVTNSVWNGEKANYENITYLSMVRITVDFNNVYSQGYEMFDRILLFTDFSGIWDLESVWSEFKETALTPTENQTQYNQQKIIKF